MRYRIGVDAGGTFTDCVAMSVDGSQVVTSKVPTTQYDLLVAFNESLNHVGEGLGLSREELLTDSDLVVYSSTQETNRLIEHRGARVGVITTRGFEDTIFIGRSKSAVDGVSELEYKRQGRKTKPKHLVDRDMVVGVQERIDLFGRVQIALDDDEVRDVVMQLVDKGAEIFVVCLLQSVRNDAHERRVKEIIKREFPTSRLGSVPVVLSSQVSPAYREYPRMNTAIAAGFLQGGSADMLKTFQESILDHAPRPLLVMQNTGGASKITRSDAVSSIHSGPVAGTVNGKFLHRHYQDRFGTDSGIFTDVGGTSFDVALLIEGDVPTEFEPIVGRLRLQTPLVEVHSIGAGGGTIARIDPITGRLDVGPESAGSLPGPACYGLGGTAPTVTDADVVLGRLNPDYYLGGDLQLYPDLAREAIQEKLADPLGISVEEAAVAMARLIDNKMASLIEKEVLVKGRDPRDFVLYSYGGAGPSHCVGFLEILRPKGIVVPARSSVFSAFGAAISPVRHKYWRAYHFDLWDPIIGFAREFDDFNAVCAALEAKVRNDMHAEGYANEDYTVRFEFEMKYGPMLWESRTPVSVDRLTAENAPVVKDEFTERFVAEFGDTARYETGGIVIEGVLCTATSRAIDAELQRFDGEGEDPAAAHAGQRQVTFNDGTPRDAAIYRMTELRAGNVVRGPAVIEALDTTYVVPAGWRVTFDEYMNGLFEEEML